MKNLIGKKFNKLLVLQKVKSNKWGNTYWLCLCDCGREKIVRGDCLRKGLTKSCGCINLKHGHNIKGKKTRVYIIWQSMKRRCLIQIAKHIKIMVVVVSRFVNDGQIRKMDFRIF